MTTPTDRLRTGWPTGDQLSYGGDYNPEQWPEETWPADIELMREAGINLVTVGVFSWALLQPRPDAWDFGWLDRIMDLLHAGGIRVDLATATASPPPWLAIAHPEIRPVDANGTTYAIGSRQTWSPSSAVYRQYSLRLVEAMALRYRDHPALAMWHVSNELGCHNSRCYSAESADGFRRWLRARYTDIDALNTAWGTAFWSQRYSDFDEVVVPSRSTAAPNPTHFLDWRRFCSDRLLEQYLAERDILHRLCPDVPVTTNFMVGLGNPLSPAGDMDYAAWAPTQDIVSTDHYLVDTADRSGHERLAFSADLTRGIGTGDPWLLMEHSTSAVNWQPVNRAKAPGEMLRNSLSHLARGADGICFFQFRASASGAEKFHSAMVPHAGPDSARWREVVELGRILHAVSAVRGSRVQADVAILFDWESQWTGEIDGHPSTLVQHQEMAERLHGAVTSLGLTADVVGPTADLSRHRVIIVPALYLCDREQADRIAAAAAAGAQVLITFFSGIADRDDHVYLDGYPGAFRDLLGVRVEEFFPLDAQTQVELTYQDTRRTGRLWTETLSVADDVEVLAEAVVDAPGAARSVPVLTHRSVGSGAGWYLATLPDVDTLRDIVESVCRAAGLTTTAAPGLEVVRRRSDTGSWLFVINHSQDKATVAATGTDLLTGAAVSGEVHVAAGGCAVIAETQAH
ncbi:beta-galactosidase [Williamsia sp. CHRR-6]|uniref:beta-galactosidase n=1 Tax=Williamsia sp. CHRR-6 TaxID=2835871 RepID=UPI0027DB282D|nr:beta-galactosidase [Williamsia sp. CHRR-6]